MLFLSVILLYRSKTNAAAYDVPSFLFVNQILNYYSVLILLANFI